MSSDARWLALALVLSLPGIGRGQTIQELERRIAETRLKADQAGAAVRAHRLAAQPSMGVYTAATTIARGGVVIRYTPDLTDKVLAAARRADSLLEYQLGAVVERARGDTFLVRSDTSQRGRSAIAIEYRPGGRQGGRALGRMSVAELVDNLIGSLGPEIVTRRWTPLREWMPGPHVLTAAERGLPINWAWIRMALVTSPSRVARGCYAGSIPDCASALQLVPVADPAMAWYDSAGRFEYVKGREDREMRVDRAGTERCLQHSDRDCLAVMRRLFEGERTPLARSVGAPVDASVRWSLERFALETGGLHANERMLSDSISAVSALTAAAGIPLDTLISRWRATAARDAAISSDFSLRMALTALAWIALMLFLALRSPRWR